MKVIKHGIMFEYTVTCPVCECVFECDVDEVEKECEVFGDSLYAQEKINCPECEAEICLKQEVKKVPKWA